MKYSQGFTLLELLVTLAVVAIVVTLAAPGFTETITNNRLSAQTNQTTGMLMFARSEAAKRKVTVTACVSTDQSSCAAGGAWESGWLIVTDSDADGTVDAGTDEILQFGLPLEGGNTLRASGFTNANFIQFNPMGLPDSTGTFTLCDSRGANQAKGIVISAAGQSRLAVDQNGDGIVNNHAGNNVSCP